MNGISLNSVRAYLPSLEVASPQQILSNATKAAIPAIALFGAMYAHQADAGPISGAACMAACLAVTWGGFAPMCLSICASAFAAPIP